MKYIWRQINIGFWIETARWTKVAVAHRQPKTDLSIDEKTEVIQDESSIGVITDSRDSFVAKKRAEGEFSSNVETNWIWYLLYALLGSVSSAVDSTWAYKHTFELLETNTSPSLTTWIDDPVLWGLSFPLTMIESFTLTAEEWALAVFTVAIKAKNWESVTHSVSYTPDNKLLSRHSIFKVAANLAGLSSAEAVCLKSFEITFTKNLEDDYCLGSQTPQDFVNKQFQIEGSFTALFTDATFRAIQLAWTKKAISFELKDTSTTIGASSNPSLKFTLPLVSFTEFSKTQGNDEVVIQTLTFKGLYSNTDWESIEAELVNTVAEYVDQS